VLSFALNESSRCVERWSSVDMYAWLAQLGVVQPLG
jgi:hypothetical protein